MLSPDTLLEIELSAANLYARLSERAKHEGDLNRSRILARMAAEERGQAQRIKPGVRTGKVKGTDQWSHYWVKGQPAQRAASLGSRDPRVAKYLGPRPLEQPWSEALPKLGSAELLIAVYYLLIVRDFKTFVEELRHCRYSGVRLRYLIRGILCLF